MNKWQYFKKIQKELNFLHKQRIDTVFHITNPDPLKPVDYDMVMAEKSIPCTYVISNHYVDSVRSPRVSIPPPP